MSVQGDTSGFRVVVVGAGIAGLAAAIALRRQGHTVEVNSLHSYLSVSTKSFRYTSARNLTPRLEPELGCLPM